jgi:hypothetical protein
MAKSVFLWQSLEAVERVAALQRMAVNGNHVLILILSSLCGDVFENGTLLDVGSITAQDWQELDLDLESLLLKQSAKLVADAILSKGTKGLDLTVAVRSWRALRHLTEVVVAVVTRCRYVNMVGCYCRGCALQMLILFSPIA